MDEKLPLIGFVAELGSVTEIPAGVRPKTFSDLLNIAAAKGEPVEVDGSAAVIGFRFQNGNVDLTYYDFGYSAVAGINGLTVFKCNNDGTPLLSNEGVAIIQLKNEIMIIWDKSLTANEIEEFIVRVREE